MSISKGATRLVLSAIVVGVIIGGIGAISLADHFSRTVTVTETSTLNVASLPLYYLYPIGACDGSPSKSPCFGGNFSQALVFNCARAAASSSGCSEQVGSTYEIVVGSGYHLTIWYPYWNSTYEWVNCMYEYGGNPGQPQYAYCISTNSTAFIISEPAPPPVG